MTDNTIAVDLAKNVFEIAIADSNNRIVQQKRLSRKQFQRFIDQQPASRFVIEACGTAHFWGRCLQEHGHQAILLPAHHVKPYRRGNKTDRKDALALLEANRAPDIEPVTVKTPEQQSLQQLHRLREQWVQARTARINSARGLLREYGIYLAQGPNAVRKGIPAIIEDAEQPLPDAMRTMLFQLLEEIRQLDERVKETDRQIEAYRQADEDARRVSQIPGIGLLTSTAIIAAVGDLRQFRNGRQFAGWLGVTPTENSSGQRRNLGGITKRGNTYLRTLLIHGGRSVLAIAQYKQRAGQELAPLEQWALRTRARVGFNKASVALANKLARRVYAVCRDNTDYDSQYYFGEAAA
ncbi:MAG: IS110 family transposase [Thiohalorhabdaceae bacterium]